MLLAVGVPGVTVAAQQAATQQGTSPDPPRPTPAVTPAPHWLQLHAEHRTRYETIDTRFRAGEVGGDQHLAFRSRVQLRAATSRAWAYTEIEDARVALDDSASTVTSALETRTKVLQLHGGLAWRGLGGRSLAVQVEGGRFSRDFGVRRLIARNAYRNTTNAFDGVIARLSGPAWSVQALATRPVFYTYPSTARDARFDRTRMNAVYATSSAVRQANADAYVILWRDGASRSAADRRSLHTIGGRLFGTFGPDRRAEYDVETAIQGGQVGPRTHRAWFQHGQLGFNWPGTFGRPRLLGTWDYGSGDPTPDDARSGTFDPLLGARRFELGPTGLYGLLGRSNVVTPGVWLIARPRAALETSVQFHAIWLDEARAPWLPAGLTDPTGRAGRRVGEQTELRLRYRFTPRLDFDGAVTIFNEGPFVRAVRPSGSGRATHVYAALNVTY